MKEYNNPVDVTLAPLSSAAEAYCAAMGVPSADRTDPKDLTTQRLEGLQETHGYFCDLPQSDLPKYDLNAGDQAYQALGPGQLESVSGPALRAARAAKRVPLATLIQNYS